jgi:hypothetical protein
MFKKMILLSAIVISMGVPMTAQAAPNKPPAAKGCVVNGKTVPHGTIVDVKDRWGNTLRSFTCFDGVWLRSMRA